MEGLRRTPPGEMGEEMRRYPGRIRRKGEVMSEQLSRISQLEKENKSLREKLKDVLPLIRYTANQCHSKCVCNGQHSGMMSWCAGVENLINEYDRVSNDVKRELPGYNPPAKHPREWPE